MLPDLQELPEPLGKGTRSCPNCYTGKYLRYRPPVIYCLNCMVGMGGEGQGPVIDMYLFPTIIEEKKKTPK
jgi:hypothetical protein